MSFPRIGGALNARSVSRRSFLVGSTAFVSSAALLSRVSAQTGGSSDATFLAVADTANSQLAVYSVPSLETLGVIEHVTVATHAGFLPLASGDLLFVDEAASRLVMLSMVDGAPTITGEAPVPEGVSHLAVNAEEPTIAAVGSGNAAAPITIVDLATWETSVVARAESGEVGLALTETTLFHRNDALNRLEAYPLADVVAGTAEPVSTVQIGALGHGESIDQENGLIYCVTDDGIDVVKWDGQALAFEKTYSWSDEESIGGRGYFQRLSHDGSMVVSYISNRSAPEVEWETWTNFAMVVDTTTDEIFRPELGNGYVYRFGLADDRALFYRMGGEEDELIELDLDRESETFGEISRRTPITSMTTGPRSGDPIWEINQYRSVAITADGSFGFVTRGGDGIVDVFDGANGEISGEVATPGNLNGGGYLAIFGAGQFTDSIAR